ncbi:hypothetical protein F5Y10DRAFT_238557 [Nemania abortiva]|nr:hypothetical protein F5Y10DRAFT_238557 [Nemania abortiva]
MAANNQQRIGVECAENIAMLHLLHGVPEMPSKNPTTDIQSKQNGHTLPFAEERELAGVFAFLAHIQDDSNHIPAVCLQEVPKKRSLNIILAVNRERPGDGNSYATKIKEGFEKIAAALRDLDDQSRNLEWDIFNLITSICRERILCRLRFSKKRRDGINQKRMNIIEGLQLVVECLNKNPSKNMRSFLEKSRTVMKLASSWEKHSTLQELVELVEGINSLRQTDRFKEIMLESVPTQVVQPTTKTHLFNMIRKVSRYRESASLLIQAARKFPSLRQMQVVVVKLQDDAFARPGINQNYSPMLHATMSRVQSVKKSLRNAKAMCDLLEISEAKAGTQYGAQVKQTLKTSKIHAEVQILYYCETILNGKPPLPRVICSSKSACWLCNAILSVHKKMHTPRSHGRLYPGWRLPNLHGGWCDDIAVRLNRYLVNALGESLKDLHQRRTRTKYPEPTESDLSTIIWPLSQFSKIKLLHNIARRSSLEQLNAVVENNIPKSPEKITNTSKAAIISVEEIPAEDAVLEDTNPDDIPPQQPVSAAVSSASSASSTSLGDTSEGSQENSTSYVIPFGEISSVYPSGPLKLMFEYSSSHQHKLQGDHPPKQLLCTTKWLSLEDFEQLGLGADAVISAGSLTRDEVSHSTDSGNNIYLGFEGAVLKLTMQPALCDVDASRKLQES